MALYTSGSKDRVRDAVDFVELVSARTELRRAGPRSYEGLCPFHEERTPSFGIDPTEKVYYCFGCQASGDVFTFVQETEGVDFRGALELLADRTGVELELEREDPREAQRRQRRERLLELLGRTASYYERYLWESTEAARARDYLQKRGLGEEVLRAFRVGYAPSAWDRVLLASRHGGFSERELYETGLAQRSQENGRVYDRFRGRIMFPLADVRGRVLGFGARAMREEQKPKYLNTSDNDVYHKGRQLYGADLARTSATKLGEVIVCEGYTDVIALHQAGFRNAVGLMGTALTEDQMGELGRLAQTVLLALDADSAGQEAMLKAARLAARRKLELRVVELPAGADPAELVQQGGAEAIEEAVRQAVPFVRFRVERALASGDDSSPEGRDRMIAELRPVFATLPPSAMRMELTRLVSGRLGLSEGLAESLLGSGGGQAQSGGNPRAQARGQGDQSAQGSHDSSGSPTGGGSNNSNNERASRASRVLAAREDTERAFLALCIATGEHGERSLAEVDLEGVFTSELLRRAAEHLKAGHLAEPLRDVDEQDRELVGLLAELTVEAGRWPTSARSSKPPMLAVQQLQLQLAWIDRRIHAARAQGAGEVSELAKLRSEVKLDFDRAQERALAETGA
ncbi:MAG TPA: DNA primase [Solirubrobacteraceae bacterium]|jgi:DNA primase|nr:DNA primase [Solirubrobacteraceae bacterium]